MQATKCPRCSKYIPRKYSICPSCNAHIPNKENTASLTPSTSPTPKKTLFPWSTKSSIVILLVIALLVLVFLISSTNRKEYLAPISADAIPTETVKPEYNKYLPYFKKAVEIQRRNPDCRSVEAVDISLPTSTLDAPVFFVTCKNAAGLAFNTWLSKDLIDKFTH